MLTWVVHSGSPDMAAAGYMVSGTGFGWTADVVVVQADNLAWPIAEQTVAVVVGQEKDGDTTSEPATVPDKAGRQFVP